MHDGKVLLNKLSIVQVLATIMTHKDAMLVLFQTNTRPDPIQA